jgi:hypothetical protein
MVFETYDRSFNRHFNRDGKEVRSAPKMTTDQFFVMVNEVGECGGSNTL